MRKISDLQGHLITYILKGEGTEIWETKNLHIMVFNMLKVTGLESKPDKIPLPGVAFGSSTPMRKFLCRPMRF